MTSEAAPRILIVGTGALASLIGGRLASRTAAHVTLAGSWQAALEAMSNEGITLEAPAGTATETEQGSAAGDSIAGGATTGSKAAGGATTGDAAAASTGAVGISSTRTARVDAARVDGPLEPADIVLVLVKSYQSNAVAQHAARALADSGVIVTLQNGLGNREILAAQAGTDRVTLGVTSIGATLLAPGRVRLAGVGRTVLGAPATLSSQRVMRLRELAALLVQAGLPTELQADVDALLWRKLAASCAVNPLTALLQVTNGELLQRSQTRAAMRAAALEVGRVAGTLGIELGVDPAAYAEDVARQTAGNLSSMLQDISRGSRTEIEAINGAVVREGRRLSVPTPVNEWLYSAVRDLEDGRRRDGPLLPKWVSHALDQAEPQSGSHLEAVRA
jgi:2-dehydropantoate 2-reductase